MDMQNLNFAKMFNSRRITKTTTSLVTDLTDTLWCPLWTASLMCRNIPVSASGLLHGPNECCSSGGSEFISSCSLFVVYMVGSED